MKIIDCFTFYNEMDMLRLRLAELSGTVDYFVLAESTLTFSGEQKRLYFDEVKSEFSSYPIVHVIVDRNPETASPWDREVWQRNNLMVGVRLLSPKQDDLVLISDVDEIPDAEAIRRLSSSPPEGAVCLDQDLYYYSFDFRVRERWLHAKAMRYSTLLEAGSVERARFLPCSQTVRGGWHLSFFGKPEFVANKIRSFSHQEFNREDIVNEGWISDCMAKGNDLFKRGLKIERVDPEKCDYLPKNWRMIS